MPKPIDLHRKRYNARVQLQSLVPALNYISDIDSDVQTQLDARCLETVFGTSIGTGLLLDGTVLKASTILQKYHGIDPAANVQSLLGAADYAAMMALLTGQAGAAFSWNSQNLTDLGTLASAAGTLTIDEIASLSDYATNAEFDTHKDRHDPNDGDDALDTANAAEISVVVGAGTGTSHSLARADHVHAINHAITDNHIVTIDGTSNQNEHAVFGADGIAGLTDTELLASLSADAGATFDWNDQQISNIKSIAFNDGGATCTQVKDEDDMATDSATMLATQQSIKAYADNIHNLIRSYRIATGETVTIDDYEQISICEQFIVEGTGTLNIDAAGFLCIDGRE